jgi:two-component sensor histidine kinase
VKLSYFTDPIQLDLDVATSLGIVITELISNAYTHAFPDGPGEIVVTMRAIPEGAWLSIVDNGTGFVETETKRRGVGLVRRLLGQVGATLSLQSDQGTTWTVNFPVPEIMPVPAA